MSVQSNREKSEGRTERLPNNWTKARAKVGNLTDCRGNVVPIPSESSSAFNLQNFSCNEVPRYRVPLFSRIDWRIALADSGVFEWQCVEPCFSITPQ